ncbi:ABC-type nitrate/sulfonate/bicarbonate transport system, periplasmic component [Frankia canadensis]|uniref:ABC-type nitrate/sulfonate/bicarbonate transport system, periplasmic component n=1 Tax=Frankia canadensis TaxID=1836972 RepID=A0A2I2KRA3_9ACTN|nr:ABC transporter substrate-binding protein [Frankia canadensis]SNQ48194.1 ABC-type nitrate/sulfonate/bicarbonate transport system, periplasmic component [Frankia canadensis]SOU55484.1 ABC-type nitrate/sulfonate/bicarbonate transport system, periplasmic component [Frankia canadensis]
MHRRIRQKSKLLTTTATLAVAALLASACGNDSSGSSGGSKDERTTLRYQGSVGQVTLPELAADLGYLGPVKLEWIGNTISGPQDIQAATTGDTDFGGAFNGAIIKLISAGAPIKSVISYYGVDKDQYSGYYVLEDSPIRSARDLIGKKVGMNTLGAHLEAVLDAYLKKEGLSSGDIDKVVPTVVPPVNTEQALRAGQIEVGALGGILRDKALERGGIRPLFSDYDLYGTFAAGSYVLRTDFIKKNPTTVTHFVEGVARALEWAKSHSRDEVVARFTQIIDKRNRKEDKTAIKFWKSYGVPDKGGLITDENFTRWIDFLRDDGQLKKDVKPADLYTNEFNPFRPGGPDAGR